jgi:hypothetical protein
VLDSFKPGWRTERGSEVVNWFPDMTNMFAFWIYPTVTGGKLSLNVAVTPAEIPSLSSVVVPLDALFNPLLNYVLHRAYAKDAETAQSAQLSAAYLSLFNNDIGLSKE